MSENTKEEVVVGTFGQKFATGLMLTGIKWILDPELIKQLFELVEAYINVDGLDGPEKKKKIMSELEDVKVEGKKLLSGLASFLLDTAIGIIHAYITVRANK